MRYNVKKYSGSPRVESIGLDFSWVVHRGRASVRNYMEKIPVRRRAFSLLS